MKQPKYFIQDVNFDLDDDDEMTPHLAYTIAEQGGAASGWNDPLLLKAKAEESPEVKEFLATLHKMKQDKELSSEGSQSPQDMLKGTSSAPLDKQKDEIQKGKQMSEFTQEKVEEIVKAALATKDAENAALQEIVKSLQAKQEASEKAEVMALVKSFVADAEEAVKVGEQVFTLRKAGLVEAADVLVASLKKAHEMLAESAMFKEVGVKTVAPEVEAKDADIIKAMKASLGLDK